MPRSILWKIGKLLEGVGLLVILVGLSLSISLGFEDEGLKSMVSEFQGLAIGGGMFAVGYLLERVGRAQ